MTPPSTAAEELLTVSRGSTEGDGTPFPGKHPSGSCRCVPGKHRLASVRGGFGGISTTRKAPVVALGPPLAHDADENARAAGGRRDRACRGSCRDPRCVNGEQRPMPEAVLSMVVRP